MSYSSLNNSFSIVANEYGTGSKVDISSDAQGLFEGLGLTASSGAVATAGTNLEVTINGRDYESNGNSIEADGTTFSFSSISEGADFTASIDKDTSGIADTLKDFIKDYNALIKDVFAKLDEKPESKYYFLTDADKEDLELSDKQEEKWEEKSKLGLLYHDSAITNVMNKLRTSLMGTVTDANGDDFGLASMGIVTATDYKQHGTLVIKDENKFLDAIANHADDIAKLFSDTEKGIMKAFSDNLDSAVKATGDKKGILVQKAGLSTGTSATSNQLYDMIKRTKTKIASLTKRYEGQQDRLWKRYSSMESLMGEMNSQQSSLMSYFG
jgi:flagellar hook-associated protein 2